MVNLTEQERIFLLMMRGWGDRERSYEEVVHLFNDTFRKRVQIRIAQNLGDRKLKTTEERQEVGQSFIENRRLSINKASQQLGMSRFSVYKNLKILKYHPYKIHLHQELNEDYFDRRVQFSEIMMERIIQDANFLPLIIFSDEASFQLNGNSDENPHWMLEKHTQHPQKINVWVGLFGDQIIGPFFINGNLD
ncbi:hypothetical protein NQ315_000670, partial [Exocentrus adspersus]